MKQTVRFLQPRPTTTEDAAGKRGARKAAKSLGLSAILRCQLVAFLLLALLALGIVMNVNTGTVHIPVLRVFEIIFSRSSAGSMESSVIIKIRLPMLMTSALLGGALSVSGFLLQTFSEPNRRALCAGDFIGRQDGGWICDYLCCRSLWQSASLMVLAAFAGSLLIMGFVLIFRALPAACPCCWWWASWWVHLFGRHQFLYHLCQGQRHRQPDLLVAGQLFRRGMGKPGHHQRHRRPVAAAVFADFKAYECLSSGRRLRPEHGHQYQAFPVRADHPLQRAFRLRDGLCRPHLLCGDRGTSDQ